MRFAPAFLGTLVRTLLAVGLVSGCGGTGGLGSERLHAALDTGTFDAGSLDAGTLDDAGTVDDGGIATLPTCPNRPAGRTQMDVLVRVDRYDGLQSGRNGSHEVVEGVIVQQLAVADPSVVDSTNVKVAMNVASSVDPSGLPQEIALQVGDTFEVVGEYIPASSANVTTVDGSAGVLHFTHTPCGSVTVNGHQYQ